MSFLLLSIEIKCSISTQNNHDKTRSKIYRCDSNKAAMVVHDLVTSKCQTKVKYEWNNGYIFKCSDIQMSRYLNVFLHDFLYDFPHDF